MTLILSCLTDRYAIQVSDRRLTLQDGSVYDDDSNKAILLNGHIAFGYTGLAFLDNGNTRTDDWFLDALIDAHKANPDASLSDRAKRIARSATQALANVDTTPESKRLAFIGVGWGMCAAREGYSPIYLTISNCHDSKGRWISQAQPEFSVRAVTPSVKLPVMLISDGQKLGTKLEKRVLRLLNTCVKKGLSPRTISRILIATVRNVASSNNFVGKNLIICSIPKESFHPGTFVLTDNPPSGDRQTFAYVPENTYARTEYGPYIFAYGTAIKGYVCSGNNPQNTLRNVTTFVIQKISPITPDNMPDDD